MFIALTSISCARSATSEKGVALNEQVAGVALKTLGCELPDATVAPKSLVNETSLFTDKLFDRLYEVVLANENFASSAQMKAILAEATQSGRFAKLSVRDQTDIIESLTDLYKFLTVDVFTVLVQDPFDLHEQLEALTAIEMLDTSTPERARLVATYKAKLAALDVLIRSQDEAFPECDSRTLADLAADTLSTLDSTTQSVQPVVGSLLANIRQSRHPLVYGGLKSLAVAYQSCEAPTHPTLTPATPPVRGVTITGQWPHSPGRKREITDLAELIASHPYLKSYRRPKVGCFDVLKNPMIYDYGGKPSTSVGAAGGLDFFTDQGGTKVLGIDCSGYVFSSLATAGLRLTKNQKIKPVYVHNTNAAKFMDPKSSGFTCFDKVKFSGSSGMRSGDVLASGGHILIIERVGADPFGVNHIRSENECKLENMSTSRFDFRILQSASTKGGIGINHIEAVEFIDEEAAMAKGLLQYAVAACKARFESKTQFVQPATATLVRHSDEKECTEAPIALTHEACVSTCQAQSDSN